MSTSIEETKKPVAHADLKAINLPKWIEEVKHLLQPPVGNKMLYGDGQLQAFIVGGPNIRKDFHIEEGEEFFFQLKGDMRLDIMEKGKLKKIPIKEGQVFMLPPRIPHSPQRFENTVGFVVERKRLPHEMDGLRWYVGETSEILFEDWFHCTNLGTQIKEAIELFFASEDYKTGKPSRTYTDPKVKIDTELTVQDPFYLQEWIDQHPTQSLLFDHEFKVNIHRGSQQKGAEEWATRKGETIIHQLHGTSQLTVKPSSGSEEKQFELVKGDMFLVPEGFSYKPEWSKEDSVGLELYSSV